IHDVGFVPKVRIVDGVEQRGFKVMIGGGLGAQPMLGYLAFEFLPEDQIIPFTERTIRFFGRVGERTNRNKARFKFVIQKLGVEEVLRLIEEEAPSTKVKSYTVDRNKIKPVTLPLYDNVVPAEIKDPTAYEVWRKTNVVEQKQEG